jgi:PASTA domain-containing protein
MALRLGSLLPRVFVVVIVALLATATITFAAETRGGAPVPAPAQSAATQILLVPDVRGQAYVFAKSTLEEAGFAWRLQGGAPGYAANLVSSQSPAPGTRVYDTGAPPVLLSLRANSRYPQAGTPENASPFSATALRLVGVVVKPKAKPKAKPKKKASPAHKAVAKKPVAKKHMKPKPKPKKPKPKKPKPKPKPNVKRPSRPPAFTVAGAKPEPVDEEPLTTRAQKLDAWVSSHQKLTNANVRYWLYQHAWIVTGARLGWWHGAQALETLVAVDRKIERAWGIGKRSERVARVALAEVRKKSR